MSAVSGSSWNSSLTTSHIPIFRARIMRSSIS